MSAEVRPRAGDEGLGAEEDAAAVNNDTIVVIRSDAECRAPLEATASKEPVIIEDDLVVGSWAQPVDSPDVARERRSFSGCPQKRNSLSSARRRASSLASTTGPPPYFTPSSRSSVGQTDLHLPDVLTQGRESLGELLLPPTPPTQREIELADIQTANESASDASSISNGAHASARDTRGFDNEATNFSMTRVKSQIADVKKELRKHGIDYDDYGLTGAKQALTCLSFTGVLLVVMLVFVVTGHTSTPEERALALQRHREHLIHQREQRRGRLAAFMEKHLHQDISTLYGGGRDLINSQVNTQGDTKALAVVFWTSVAMCIAILLLYTCLKSRYPRMYFGRMMSEEADAPNLYSKVTDRVSDPEADKIIEKAGLDAWMFLQYHSMNCRLFRLIGSLTICVLCPLHFFSGPRGVRTLSAVGINNLPDSSWIMWVHGLIAFIVVVVASDIVYKEHMLFLRFRYSWLCALPKPQATTLMVQNIPEEFRTDGALQKYFAQFEFQKGSVERAYVVRNTGRMKHLYNAVQQAEDNLIRQHRRWEKMRKSLRQPRKASVFARKSAAPSRQLTDTIHESQDRKEDMKVIRAATMVQSKWRGRVDRMRTQSRLAAADRLRQAETALSVEQDRIETDALTSRSIGSEYFSSSGLVTFSSMRVAMSASQRQYRADSNELIVEFAPEPSDVQYDELAKTRSHGLIKDFLGSLCLVLAFFYLAPVVLLITSLMSIESLCESRPWLDEYMRRPGIIQGFLTGLSGTGLLKIFQHVLPKILLLTINQCFSLKTESSAQLILQKWYCRYQVLFVVLAPAIGESLLSAMIQVIDDPTVVFVVLAESLPEASHTYVNFVVLSCAIVFVELLRVVRVGKYIMFRVIMPRRQAYMRAQVEDLAFTGMGNRMTKAVTMTTVVLLFCTCAPMITFFGYLYFFIGRSTYAFLFTFAEVKKADLGGAFWVEAVNHFFFGILLFLVLIMGILGTRSGCIWPSCMAGSSVIFLVWRWYCCRTCVWKQLPFDEVLRLDRHAEEEDIASQMRVGEYIQPECAKRKFDGEHTDFNDTGTWH